MSEIRHEMKYQSQNQKESQQIKECYEERHTKTQLTILMLSCFVSPLNVTNMRAASHQVLKMSKDWCNGS